MASHPLSSMITLASSATLMSDVPAVIIPILAIGSDLFSLTLITKIWPFLL